MEPLSGTLQRYTWGTLDAIPTLLGIEADARPYAEYWLGAHESSPSTVGGESLLDRIAAGPSVLGDRPRKEFGEQLPYLMKVLSARHALSLQAHPSREQAEEGWARENRAGVALDAPERTYKDAWPKPEIMISLDEFHSLSGFRDPHRSAELFQALGIAPQLGSVIGPLTERKGPAALAEVFLDILSLADPGIVAALLMNRIVLQPGEAIFVPAGMMHAHLRGTGIEVMANSDNVIRGGLTAKHIDVPELIQVVQFSPTTPEILPGNETRPGVWKYETPCSEFEAWRLELDDDLGTIRVPGRGAARILLVVEGHCTLTNAEGTLSLAKGESAFLSGDDPDVAITGSGRVFGASSGIR